MLYQTPKTRSISFPLGGIGTGSIALGGDGQLIDWEIFNRPNKRSRNGYTHFAIKATKNNKSILKVLHGDTVDSFMGTTCKSQLGNDGYGYGPRSNSMAGFPHFKNLEFEGTFPIARLSFSDEEFPGTVRLCAFNPFIPHDEYNSSLPVALFQWEIENTCEETVRYALGGTLCNPAPVTQNQQLSFHKQNGILFRSVGLSDTEVGYSDLCLLTDGEDTATQEYWYRGQWKDGCTTYWKNFLEQERMPPRSYTEPHKKDHGTVVSYVELPPGTKACLRFVLAWNVPIAENYTNPRKGKKTTWRNYYATQWKDSFASASYALQNFSSLRDRTIQFSDALQSSTLPEAVKDAVSANLSVLKSPTSLRLEDGSFWGWEGCFETEGACYGTCQHVWNYAYAMPYLFPRLERSIRESFLRYGLQENGASNFRLILPPEKDPLLFRSCVDGQMGEVIKCYREWKISGKDDWLKEHAEGIFKMLEYAWSPENPDAWDRDMDGILEGRQHHTLDMELFGPSSWLQGLYLLALDCGAKIADFVGDEKRARLYTQLYESGKTKTNELLFNGRYFSQAVELSDRSLLERFDAVAAYWNAEAKEIKYQVAEGCMIDQMLADWHATLIGAKGVFDSDKKKIALKHLFRYNFKESMRDVTNMWRNFSLNDEQGALICTYPEGARVPAIPLPYSEETMTGFEYALAGLLLSEGFVSEGERMVKAIRDRFDGEKRNPWNEFECGSNYARSMASFALLPIYSGFSFDMSKKQIGFCPIGGKGRYLFSVGESWGTYESSEKRSLLQILGEPLTLRFLSIPQAEKITSLTVDGKPLPFQRKNGGIDLGEVTIHKELILQ